MRAHRRCMIVCELLHFATSGSILTICIVLQEHVGRPERGWRCDDRHSWRWRRHELGVREDRRHQGASSFDRKWWRQCNVPGQHRLQSRLCESFSQACRQLPARREFKTTRVACTCCCSSSALDFLFGGALTERTVYASWRRRPCISHRRWTRGSSRREALLTTMSQRRSPAT